MVHISRLSVQVRMRKDWSSLLQLVVEKPDRRTSIGAQLGKETGVPNADFDQGL